MAKKKNKKGHTPSADEIIEALAVDMGVEEDNPPPVKADDPMAGLGDIFDIPTKKKKPVQKAAKPVKAQPKAAEKPEAAETPRGSSTPATSDTDSALALFNVGVDDDDDIELDDNYTNDIDDDEIDAFERKAGGGTNKLMIGVILILACAVGFLVFKDDVQDIKDVFSGEYRDKKDAAKKAAEEEHLQKQKDALEKYGNLRVGGEPNNALVKFQFEGDSAPRVIYARTSESPEAPFRELLLPTILHNLKIKKPFSVTIEAPGYRTETRQINESNWRKTPVGDYQYEVTAYLEPASTWHQEELRDRMLPFDEEEDGAAFGTVQVNSNPPGAQIKINGRLVVDDDGKPILTPTSLTHIPKAPPVEGKKKAADAKRIKVNTPPGQGHKIEVFTVTPGSPSYVTAVQRSLWNCKTKEDKALKRLAKDARPALKCDYHYTINGDFTAINAEILRQKKIADELQKQKEELERIQNEANSLAEPKE